MTTKKKSIYLSILGVGLCVVAYDLLSGGDEPAAASAAEPSTLDKSVGGSPETDIQAGLASLSVPHFPNEFEPSLAQAVLRDIFTPTDSTMKLLKHTAEELSPPGQEKNEPEAPPEPFADRHSLSAIMVVAGSRCAIVDKKVLRQGQSLSDCVVTEIGDRQVRFDCGDTLEELWLVDPLLGDQSK